jgi:putative PIN family toxin of toxin-antitoxin system
MIAAAFDCMVYLQAATSDRGPAFACLALAESNAVGLYVSAAVLAEVRDVLTRPDIRIQFPHLTAERVDLFLQKLATIAIVVNDVSDAGVALRDVDDLPYVNLAVAANVGYLVSWDPHLLDLMKDAAFVGRYPQLRVANPVAFLVAARGVPRP